MSYQAVTWAIDQDIPHSSAKFVLVVMAHKAHSATWESYLTVKTIAGKTGQDRKTVIANITRLVDLGFLIDTKRRVGETGQIPVYRLNGTENGTVSGDEGGGDEEDNGTEFGTAKDSQKRDSSQDSNSTVFPGNSTVFPSKESQFSVEESQFSLERVPKTGHEREILRTKNTTKNKSNKPAAQIELPEWMPVDAWNGFIEMRKTIKKPMTDRGKELAIEKLKKLLDAGQNIEAVLNESTMNNWQGLFEIKSKPNGKVDKHGGFGKQDYHAGVADDGSF
jgi:hypothetical protein